MIPASLPVYVSYFWGLTEKQSDTLKDNVKAIIDKIRCQLPKVFYDAVKQATKSKGSSIMALGFSPTKDANGY